MQTVEEREHLNLDPLIEDSYNSKYSMEMRNYDIPVQEECNSLLQTKLNMWKWNGKKINNTIQNVMKMTLPNKENTKRKKWVINEVSQKMGQRRQYKNNDKEMYNEIIKKYKTIVGKLKKTHKFTV